MTQCSSLVLQQTGRRLAPPPPPPQSRRTQPELMKELAAEMVDRKLYQQSDSGEGEVNGEQSGGGEEVKHEGAPQTDEVSTVQCVLTSGPK